MHAGSGADDTTAFAFVSRANFGARPYARCRVPSRFEHYLALLIKHARLGPWLREAQFTYSVEDFSHSLEMFPYVRGSGWSKQESSRGNPQLV